MCTGTRVPVCTLYLHGTVLQYHTQVSWWPGGNESCPLFDYFANGLRVDLLGVHVYTVYVVFK